MTTLRLMLEYDGTDFHGWQRQSECRTVEGVLATALSRVTGEQPRLSGAGRTDAGAHSHGQVVGVELQRTWDPTRLRRALNAVLPNDVAVRQADPAPTGFHARYDALRRTYRYVVLTGADSAPLVRRYAWEVEGALDETAMRAAAEMLRGTHDFACYGTSPKPGGSTVRTVLDVSLRRTTLPDHEAHSAYVIEVSANAFLYGMMRRIAGALVAVGQHRLTPADVAAALADPTSARPGRVAPARGLHQWRVTYAAASSQPAEQADLEATP